MTEKQIKELKKTLPEYNKMTKEQKILIKKIEIANIMISNLAYGEDYFEMVKQNWYIRNTTKFDWEELEDLGIKDGMQFVKDLWEEMKEDFKRYAIVNENVYTDCEGLSYNSITWLD